MMKPGYSGSVNPVLPSWEYVPDVEPRIFDGRLYLYGSHDRFGGEDFCLNDYVGWSAPVEDLSAWRYEGVTYRAAQDPMNPDGDQHLFAPDAIRGADGRYYLFYCLSRTSAVGVAVCDTPAGKFRFYGHVRHPDGTVFGGNAGDPFCFDPGVLRDKDGRIWLYVGFAPAGQMRALMQQGGLLVDGCYCVELAQDMVTVQGTPTLVAPAAAVSAGTGFEGHAFYEAASPRRIGERYYLVYSSQQSHELCYAIAAAPDQPFHYGGVILSNGDVGLNGQMQAVNYTGNVHGGMVQIKGKWFLFYHRQTNRLHFNRQCCAEAIEILPDGSIPQVEISSCGLNGSPLPGSGRYAAAIACNLSAGEGTYFYGRNAHPAQERHPYLTQLSPDQAQSANQYIANLRDGAWAAFKYFEETAEAQILLRGRGSFSGTVEVCAGRGTPPLAQIAVTPTAEWADFTATIQPAPGVHALYFTLHGSGIWDFEAFEIF